MAPIWNRNLGHIDVEKYALPRASVSIWRFGVCQCEWIEVEVKWMEMKFALKSTFKSSRVVCVLIQQHC